MSQGSDHMVSGNVDVCVLGSYLGGWVFDAGQPDRHDAPVHLRINGRPIAQVKADLTRGDGFHGFRIPYSSTDLDTLLLTNKITVCTYTRDNSEVILNIHKPLLSRLNEDRVELAKIHCKEVVQNTISGTYVAVGTKSGDGSAVFGKDGYIFLYKGSNDVASLYAMHPESPEIASVVEAWISLFRRRFQVAYTLGAAYIQLVIPEKSSILVHKTPVGIGPITPTLQLLEQVLAKPEAGGRQIGYRSLVSPLRDCANFGLQPFLRTDSHLSVDGCSVAIISILHSLAELRPALLPSIELLIQAIEAVHTSHVVDTFSGDLAGRFFSVPLFEVINQYSIMRQPFNEENIETQILSTPPNGGHIGNHIQWRNFNAPLQLKVVAFSNSFFERGSAPRGLSWWCKFIFAEFHFVWSPEVKLDIVKHLSPDLIIGQTIERFLHIIPPN